MKRIMYLLVGMTTLCLVLPVQAQRFYVGIQGGLNFADMEITFHEDVGTSYDIESRTCFGAGGILGVRLYKYISIQVEPMVMQKGGIYHESPNPGVKIKSVVLEVPLFFKVGIGKKIRPYLLAGPMLAFILSSHAKAELLGIMFDGDLKEVFKSTELGVGFGAGLDFRVWKGTLFIEGRYAFGLTNINKGGTPQYVSGTVVIPGDELDARDEFKTKGIQIMLGYTLPLGGD